MKKKRTICIMADFGKGPYAWLRQADELPPFVGINIANAWDGFEDGFEFLKILENDFKKWIYDFENNCNKKDFNWKEFNRIGIDLSGIIKHIVGNKYNVEYHIPWEDPIYNDKSHSNIIVIEE